MEKISEPNLKPIEELNLQDEMEQKTKSVLATVTEIYEGRLIDILAMTRDLTKLGPKAKEWLDRKGDSTYILIRAKLEDGTPVDIILNKSVNKNSLFYQMAKKYKKIAVGMKIEVRYDTEKMRFVPVV